MSLTLMAVPTVRETPEEAQILPSVPRGGGVGEDEGGAADHEGEGGGLGGDGGVDNERKISVGLHVEPADGVVSGVVREVVVGEDGGAAACCEGDAVEAADHTVAEVAGGEGGAPDLGLGLRGRGELDVDGGADGQGDAGGGPDPSERAPGGGVGEDEGGAADHEGEGGGLGGDGGVDNERKISVGLHVEPADGVVSGVVREVVVGEDGGAAACCGGDAVEAADHTAAEVDGGEGGAPDLGLGLRGRGQGQQRGGGQQGQAGPRAGAVRSLPGLATAPGSRKSPAPAAMPSGSDAHAMSVFPLPDVPACAGTGPHDSGRRGRRNPLRDRPGFSGGPYKISHCNYGLIMCNYGVH